MTFDSKEVDAQSSVGGQPTTRLDFAMDMTPHTHSERLAGEDEYLKGVYSLGLKVTHSSYIT
jgi:hypothetical protein